jgi:hypothetical protein
MKRPLLLEFVNELAIATSKYWLIAAATAFIVFAAIGSPTGNSPTEAQLRETNAQLRRIADSLEIIAGTRHR